MFFRDQKIQLWKFLNFKGAPASSFLQTGFLLKNMCISDYWKLPSVVQFLWPHWPSLQTQLPNMRENKYLGLYVTYAFQSESTLYSCLNVKELLVQSRREIWSLSDCNWTQTQNHLVRKRTLSHLTKLAKWLSFEWLM